MSSNDRHQKQRARPQPMQRRLVPEAEMLRREPQMRDEAKRRVDSSREEAEREQRNMRTQFAETTLQTLRIEELLERASARAWDKRGNIYAGKTIGAIDAPDGRVFPIDLWGVLYALKDSEKLIPAEANFITSFVAARTLADISSRIYISRASYRPRRTKYELEQGYQEITDAGTSIFVRPFLSVQVLYNNRDQSFMFAVIGGDYEWQEDWFDGDVPSLRHAREAIINGKSIIRSLDEKLTHSAVSRIINKFSRERLEGCRTLADIARQYEQIEYESTVWQDKTT